jgi:hypothetical protein
LRGLGYVEHHTVDIDYRYAGGDTEPLRLFAQELIALTERGVRGGAECC